MRDEERDLREWGTSEPATDLRTGLHKHKREQQGYKASRNLSSQSKPPRAHRSLRPRPGSLYGGMRSSRLDFQPRFA